MKINIKSSQSKTISNQIKKVSNKKKYLVLEGSVLLSPDCPNETNQLPVAQLTGTAWELPIRL